MSRQVQVEFWGDFACFTQPQHKVERISYEFPTPSAVRGMLEAIFWKPEFTWVVKSIQVLYKPVFVELQRNEVQNVASTRNMDSPDFSYNFKMTQRTTHALKDVRFIVTAEFDIKPKSKHNAESFACQFERRVKRGGCAYQPYMGCREFTAHFAPAPEEFSLPSPLLGKRQLGRMLHSIQYIKDPDGPYTFWEHEILDSEEDDLAKRRKKEVVSGRCLARFFSAVMVNGLIVVPPLRNLPTEEVVP